MNEIREKIKTTRFSCIFCTWKSDKTPWGPSSPQNMRLRMMFFSKLCKTKHISNTESGTGGGGGGWQLYILSQQLSGQRRQKAFSLYLIGRSSEIHRTPSGQHPQQQQQQLDRKWNGRNQPLQTAPDRLTATATAAAGHLTAPSPPEAADESGPVRGCAKVQWQRPLESSANS